MEGPEILIPMLGIVGFFSAVITFFYLFFKSRHAERMALIESGRTADIFRKSKSEGALSFKLGLLLAGLGGGLFTGLFMEQIFGLWDASGAIPLTVLGGGLGLIVYYLKMNPRDRYYDDMDS